MMRLLSVLTLLIVVVTASAYADQTDTQPMPTVKRVTGDELQREITGNTLTGRHASGMPYSEFHSPDGRIYGHNNNVAVRDGCWVIRQDQVCYTYEKGPSPGVFCWDFYRAPSGYTILLPASGTIGTAKLEPGNPQNWSNGGEPWSCEALLSFRGGHDQRDVITRYAARLSGAR